MKSKQQDEARSAWHQEIESKFPESEYDWLHECDARDWLRRFKQKEKAHGWNQARAWWLQMCENIERARGAAGLADLKERMNRERIDNPSGLSKPRPVSKPDQGKALGGAASKEEGRTGTGLLFD